MRYWFKAKYYGWGWYPATWEGFVVMLVWILLFVAGEIFFTEEIKVAHGTQILSWFIPYVLIITAALIYVTYKTGEPPRWRWGGKDIFKNDK